jgi:ribosomal protein S18 acetylase RimI-like enzyme
MTSVHFRKLLWSDFQSCKQLFLDTFDLNEDKYFFKAWKNRHKEGSFVVESFGSILGFGLVDNEYCIQYLVVSEHCRGQNIGSKLLHKILNELKDAPSVWLKTASDPRLKHWYAKFGFEEEHTYLDDEKQYLGTCMIRRQRGRNSRHNSIDTDSLKSDRV